MIAFHQFNSRLRSFLNKFFFISFCHSYLTVIEGIATSVTLQLHIMIKIIKNIIHVLGTLPWICFIQGLSSFSLGFIWICPALFEKFGRPQGTNWLQVFVEWAVLKFAQLARSCRHSRCRRRPWLQFKSYLSNTILTNNAIRHYTPPDAPVFRIEGAGAT